MSENVSDATIAAARVLGHFPPVSTAQYVLDRCSRRFLGEVQEALDAALPHLVKGAPQT